MKLQEPGKVHFLLYLLASLLLKLLGWKVENTPPAAPKYVVIVAPHTTHHHYAIAPPLYWKYRMKGASLRK